MYSLGLIIGKKVVAIKAFILDKRKKKYLEPRFILFSDKKTYIDLQEQDYYSFHDCSDFARYVYAMQDEKRWKDIYDNLDGCYPDANSDI